MDSVDFLIGWVKQMQQSAFHERYPHSPSRQKVVDADRDCSNEIMYLNLDAQICYNRRTYPLQAQKHARDDWKIWAIRKQARALQCLYWTQWSCRSAWAIWGTGQGTHPPRAACKQYGLCSLVLRVSSQPWRPSIACIRSARLCLPARSLYYW